MKTASAKAPAFLTPKQEERLVMACLETGPKTEEEVTRAFEWAHETRLRAEMLNMVLAGRLCIGVTPDDITFTDPAKAVRL